VILEMAADWPKNNTTFILSTFKFLLITTYFFMSKLLGLIFKFAPMDLKN